VIKIGQYYKPINLCLREYAYSHDYDQGLKLMEHSWVGNVFVGVIMNLLKKGGRWYKHKIIWCGDYAEVNIDVLPDKKKLMAEALDGEVKLYDFVEKNGTLIKDKQSMDIDEQKKAILINHTKKEYVMYSKLNVEPDWAINPLPLLTAKGNGSGGGDYRGSNEDEVGSWAGDSLSVEFEEPKGYRETDVGFNED